MQGGKMKRKSIKIYQIDAFTNKIFQGNPAAVCMLNESIEDTDMQSIAQEMNLSETAFVLPKENNIFKLRWFTPKSEFSLCGHATLAASEVLFNEINIGYDEIIYETKSGILKAIKEPYGISLNFPSDEPMEYNSLDTDDLLNAMGISKHANIIFGNRTKKLVIHLDNEEEVRRITPDFQYMKKLDLKNSKGVGITAQMNGKYDFISRYFNPWAGVNEDSVTGSVHTLLATYWAHILDKKILRAYQASYRSGEILLRLKDNNRLELIGQAVVVLKGEIYLYQ
jgi:PhzF family phenazine biosynthesis protein